MRKYIIALTIDLPENMPPERWLSARMGSVQLKDVNVHIEEVKTNEKVSKTNNDSGNRKRGSGVEGSSKKSDKPSGSTES